MSGARVLVCGVGNELLGDDGFGPVVARRLAAFPLPADVEVVDFGVRALHLALRLCAPPGREAEPDADADATGDAATAGAPDLVVLVDATRRGAAPGTLFLIAPEVASSGPPPDGHGMDLESVLAMARALAGRLPRLLLLGCEPSTVEEGVGLSPEVQGAIEPAVARLLSLLRAADPACVEPTFLEVDDVGAEHEDDVAARTVDPAARVGGSEGGRDGAEHSAPAPA